MSVSPIVLPSSVVFKLSGSFTISRVFSREASREVENNKINLDHDDDAANRGGEEAAHRNASRTKHGNSYGTIASHQQSFLLRISWCNCTVVTLYLLSFYL